MSSLVARRHCLYRVAGSRWNDRRILHLAVAVHDANLFPFDSPSNLSGNYSVPDKDALEPTGRNGQLRMACGASNFQTTPVFCLGGRGPWLAEKIMSACTYTWIAEHASGCTIIYYYVCMYTLPAELWCPHVCTPGSCRANTHRQPRRQTVVSLNQAV